MATILQLRRGTTVQHSSFTGANGEVTVDTTKKTVVVHDGSTAGGSPLATEAYVTSQIQTKDNTDEITEGSTNLYFTTARARNAISAGTGISISSGEIAVDTSTIATKAYADSAASAAVATVIDSAPAALDTLNELAAAINDDASYASTVSTALGNRLRVDVNTQNLTSTQQGNALTNLGLTASLAELNYVDGVTSSIQTQLDAKFASADFNSSFDTRLGTKSTTNLSEGTNLYYTNNRARGAISVTDSGGDGSLSYDSATGVITYTGPSASDVRAHFSAGTGITITSGAIAVDSTIATKTYADNAATTAVAAVIDSAPAALDTLNELAAALGDDANYSATTTTALGNRLRVDVNNQNLTSTQQGNALTNLGITASNTELNYVDGVTSAIQTQLDAKFASADFNSSFDTRLGTKSTTNLSEGTNLYFTTARARDAFSAGTGITITNGEVATTITQYTDALARAAVSVTDAGGEGSLSYNSTTGVITYTGPSASDILTAIKTVDGSGSGLDADLLDGNSSSHYRINVYDASGTLLN